MHCVNEARIEDLATVVIAIVTVLRLNLITVHADATKHPNVNSGALMSRTPTHNLREICSYSRSIKNICADLSL